MFRVNDNAIAPRKAHFQRAVARLPQAHQVAHTVATQALHGHLRSVADSEGLDTSAIVLFRHKGRLNVGIDAGPNGAALMDHEFGNLDSRPNATLRNAARHAHPSLSHLYARTLQQEIGL